MDVTMNQELVEERRHELLEALGKLKPEDPNYEKIMKNLDALSKMSDSYESREQTRLNNNATNDINEQKLIIEQQKLKLDKKRAVWDRVKTFLFVGTTLLTTWLTYNYEKTELAFRPAAKDKDKMQDHIIR